MNSNLYKITFEGYESNAKIQHIFIAEKSEKDAINHLQNSFGGVKMCVIKISQLTTQSDYEWMSLHRN